MCQPTSLPPHVLHCCLTYSLAQRSALSNGNLVTLHNTEGWGDVGSEVLVSLLVTGVLGNKVQVLPADDDGTVHLGGHDGAGQDTATDGDETGEGALLVCRRQSRSAVVRVLALTAIRKLLVPFFSSSGPLFHEPHKQSSFMIRRKGWKGQLDISHTDVLALNGSLGGTETQTNILVPPALFLHRQSSTSFLVAMFDSKYLGYLRHPCQGAWSCSW